MLARKALPLVDLSKRHNSAAPPELRQALLSFGACRLAVPPRTQHLSKVVFEEARAFFEQTGYIKQNTKGFSAFSTELVRGETPIPKESVYFFRNDTQQGVLQHPPQKFLRSITSLHEEWKPARNSLLSVLSTTLGSDIPLTGAPSLDYNSIGVHYYDSRQLNGDSKDFSPAHMDSGTLTILIRDPNHGDDMLEVANLDTTEKLDSKGIGLEASFIPVPVAPNEVVVLTGTRLQRLIGKNDVRACVHKVRSPVNHITGQNPVSRLSIAIFCAPPVV